MKRNNDGLIDGLTYQYKENGRIDWRKMVPNEYLYLNPERKSALEKKYNKKYEEITLGEAEDKDLVILLGGIRYLLDLRGYSSVNSNLIAANQSYAAVSCRITFIANSEEGMQTFTDNACAHFQNTKGFGNHYLVEIATNRAFCRCVRNFLNINIVSKEELGEEKDEEIRQSTNTTEKLTPTGCLSDLMTKANKSFEDILKALHKDGINIDNIKKIEDIPADEVFKLIDRLNKKILKN